MKLKMYSIQDIKSDSFAPPFTANNEEVAKRTVQQALQGESLLSSYPEDYRLFEVGTFNNTTGEIEIEKQPKWVANLTEFSQPKEH